jgi:hypothetical protein
MKMNVIPIKDVLKQNSPSILKPSEKNTSLPLKQFSDYWLENMALPNPSGLGQLQITSICDSRCEYCSNDSNEFLTGRNKFRDLGEIEKVLWAIPFSFSGTFYLNESLPGRISEGEALLHPDIDKVMGLIRARFPYNVISITTSGSQLSQEMVERIAPFTPIDIVYSIPSFQEKHWNAIYKLKEKHFNNFINSFAMIRNHLFTYHANITPLPSMVGYDDLDNTIRCCKEVGINYINIYAPGYTKYTPEKIIGSMIYDKQELSNFLSDMSRKHDVLITWPLDPNIPLSFPINNLSEHMKNIYRQGHRECYWMVSTAVASRFKEVMDKITRTIPVEAHVIPVENSNYGGNIEVAGLLVVDDIRKKVEELGLQGKYIIVPSTFLDLYGFDLNSENFLDYIKTSSNYFYVFSW